MADTVTISREAAELIEEALVHGMPKMPSYPEPWKRHDDALALIRAALGVKVT
jgi:hypothetical protein